MGIAILLLLFLIIAVAFYGTYILFFAILEALFKLED